MATDAEWAEARRRWEAHEPVEDTGTATGIRKTKIRQRAKEFGWGENKAETAAIARRRGIVSPAPPPPRIPAHVRDTHTEAPAQPPSSSVAYQLPEPLEPEEYLAQHQGDYQGLRNKAVALLAVIDRFQDQNVPKMLSAIAGALKLVQDGQRKALGVDKPKDQRDQDGEETGVIVLPPLDMADG